ncbi:MAG: hypothetical protein FJW20_13445 [Acidimicrobiia bacterium]|nr:hypothetical protein [Acidimicrobiia bacterium]
MAPGVYKQTVRSSLVQTNGHMTRRERREYMVLPSANRTEKRLTAFEGEYRKGGKLIPYSEPGFTYKGMDIDGKVINDLTEDLVNERESMDGIPHSLFPLRSKELGSYRFALKGEVEHKGRRAYQIAFEPAKSCPHDCPSWK